MSIQKVGILIPDIDRVELIATALVSRVDENQEEFEELKDFVKKEIEEINDVLVEQRRHLNQQRAELREIESQNHNVSAVYKTLSDYNERNYFELEQNFENFKFWTLIIGGLSTFTSMIGMNQLVNVNYSDRAVTEYRNSCPNLAAEDLSNLLKELNERLQLVETFQRKFTIDTDRRLNRIRNKARKTNTKTRQIIGKFNSSLQILTKATDLDLRAIGQNLENLEDIQRFLVRNQIKNKCLTRKLWNNCKDLNYRKKSIILLFIVAFIVYVLVSFI